MTLHRKAVSVLTAGIALAAPAAGLYAEETQSGSRTYSSSERGDSVWDREREAYRQAWRDIRFWRDGDHRAGSIRDNPEIRRDLRDVAQARAEVREERQEIRAGRRELRDEFRELAENRHDLRHALKKDDEEGAARERLAIRENKANIREGLSELERDRADLRKDRLELREARAELRDDLRDVRDDRHHAGFDRDKDRHHGKLEGDRHRHHARADRDDNGRHLGWERGKHYGWDKNPGHARDRGSRLEGDRHHARDRHHDRFDGDKYRQHQARDRDSRHAAKASVKASGSKQQETAATKVKLH
jgi:hypothetical protein